MPASLARPDYALADNLGATAGTVFMTGTQALIRLAADAAPARRRARPGVARLHQRLSRLAARHGRPAGVEGGQAARCRRRQVPAGDQRGARRDRGARHAAGRVRPRAHGRRRVRDVVRQGPGRRPRRRRAQARQRLRLVAARRRARRRRRRPRLRLVVDAAPERPDDAVVAHAGAGAGQRRRVPRVRPLRLGAVALLGQLGRLHRALGSGRERLDGRPRRDQRCASPRGRAPPRSRRRPASSARPTACTTAGPTCRR